jgi:integrase
MLYETAARASEILALNVEDLDLEQRRAAQRD